MNQLSPKQDFQKRFKSLSDTHATHIKEPWMQQALSQSLLELSMRADLNLSELQGARKFITIFLNISDVADKVPEFPKKELVEG